MSPKSIMANANQQFKAMSFAMLDEAHKQPTAYKLVVVGEEEKVVGLHIIGEGSDEIMQGCKYLITSSRGNADNQSPWLSRWELPRRTLMIPLLSVS
jgi:pyruvate/2-oxoglutarate dehydrogenase complex dihydrolipoamide dehydrogenase (E3) component